MSSFLARPLVDLTEYRFCDFYNFSVIFWNCSDSVVPLVFLLDLGTVPTVWYLLFFCQIVERFHLCGISCFSARLQNCSESVISLVYLLDFGTFPIVWYLLCFCQILELFDSVVSLVFCQIVERFQLCGISCLFVRLYNCSESVISLVFSVRIQNCSQSVVSLVFLLDFRIVPTVWYLLFFG